MRDDVANNLKPDDFEHRVPTRLSASIFLLKSTTLQLGRAAKDITTGVQRYPRGDLAKFTCILGESRTPLWTEANPTELLLQAGKVQNLRCALRRLNGSQIPAGGLFSFWKQIGQATQRRGYVAGRLLREGCLIPNVGGGLCQLSNALYDVALQTHCKIVERYAHSHLVPGSCAVRGRDATVAFNYIDLRFRPLQTILIEAQLSQDELILRFRGHSDLAHKPDTAPVPLAKPQPVINVQAHSCATCNTASCFRHQTYSSLIPNHHLAHDNTKSRNRFPPARGRTAYLVDECWPEFQAYVRQAHQASDILGIPLDGKQWQQPRYAWDDSGYAHNYTAHWQTMQRSLVTRQRGQSGAARLQAQLARTHALAVALAHKLPFEVSHLCVAQSLLPFLWHEGYLGGRSFEVLMTRLPLQILHNRLDTALATHPERHTLGEYRAPAWIVEAEAQALAAAQQVITPHSEIVALFSPKVQHLQWHQTAAKEKLSSSKQHRQSSNSPLKVAFPGPTAARKGAYELRAVAHALDLEIVLLGNEWEGESFWQGIRTCRAEANWMDDVVAVAQPALVEDNPRRLLQALAAGLPVLATTPCGLGQLDSVTVVPYGDVPALQQAMQHLLHYAPDTAKLEVEQREKHVGDAIIHSHRR